MRFSVQREALLRPLQQVVGVVERRQTLPVLANVLIRVEGDSASFTTTDLEVELSAKMAVDGAEAGEVTIPARKLFDIVRALPDGSKIDLKQEGERVKLSSGRSRYTLATLPASEFPATESGDIQERIEIDQGGFKKLLERSAFAMAVQDVRYYLNGLLVEVRSNGLRTVATDGHRLALAETAGVAEGEIRRQVIVPRKGILELQRLLEGGEAPLELAFSKNHIRARLSDSIVVSKLIDGRFPDYEAVIPLGADKVILVDRDAIRQALSRAAILSNEKYRGVKIEVSPGVLRVIAHNPEQEEAMEEIEAETTVDQLGVGFNVNYLLDALAAVDGERVRIRLRDGASSALVESPIDDTTRHVVMPLRL
ncbi:MAG: DNA polymerase III subunit beta [Lysobacterales bacterium]